jgi:hypothetical protein
MQAETAAEAAAVQAAHGTMADPRDGGNAVGGQPAATEIEETAVQTFDRGKADDVGTYAPVKAMTFAQQRALLEQEMDAESREEEKMQEKVEKEGWIEAKKNGHKLSPQGSKKETKEVHKSRHEEPTHVVMHRQLAKMQKATDELIEDNYIDQYMSSYFLHPWARLFVAIGIAFLNFWILLEDPIAHSVVEANVIIIGQVFSLVCTRWEGSAVAGKIICVVLGIFIGCVFGKKIHPAALPTQSMDHVQERPSIDDGYAVVDSAVSLCVLLDIQLGVGD